MLWLVIVSSWMWSAMRYQNTPAPVVRSAMQFPFKALDSTAVDSNSQLQKSAVLSSISAPAVMSHPKPTLVMAVHPACPCTRASLHELERVVTRAKTSAHQKFRLVVLIYRPRVLPTRWKEISLDSVARALNSERILLSIVEDTDGRKARALGLSVSGQVALYDGRDKLVFRGGVTASRGHEGDNYGSDAIAQFLETGTVARHETPVFGCSIFSASQTASHSHDSSS